MRGQSIEMEDTPARMRVCDKCGFQGAAAGPMCPQCSGRLRSSVSIRIRGVLTILLAAFLVTFMSYLTLWTIDAANENAPGGSRFTGTSDQLLAILGLFGMIIVFGFAAALAGVWQVIFGRRNRFLVWGAVGFGILMAATAFFVYWRF